MTATPASLTRVTGGLIAEGTIATANVANAAISTDKLADGAVTTAKIAGGAASVDKLAAGLKPETLINTFPAANAASLDITGFDPALYRSYRIELERVFPASAQILWLRTSTNGGSSYDAGASDYATSVLTLSAGGAASGQVSNGAPQVQLSGSVAVDASADRGFNGEVFLLSPGTAQRCALRWQGGAFDAANYFTAAGSALRLAAADVDAVRIMAPSGNISGLARLYGTRL